MVEFIDDTLAHMWGKHQQQQRQQVQPDSLADARVHRAPIGQGRCGRGKITMRTLRRHDACRAHRLAGLLGLAASIMLIATQTHAVVFTLPKGGLSANGSSRAIVTRREWDMSGSKDIPDWLVLLSREPITPEAMADLEGKLNKTKAYNDYLFDGYFLGFGILYNIGLKQALMLASIPTFMSASTKNSLLHGWDMVNQRPRLGPTETTWHKANESYKWEHMLTLGSNLGIFRIHYEEKVYKGHGIRDPDRQDQSRDKPWRPRTTWPPEKPTPKSEDSDGEPTPAPLPDKYWRIPTGQFTDPGVSNDGGQLVYPERPILDKNCWAYSYASYWDGTFPNPGDPPQQRFWARWPVKALGDCAAERPQCMFTFDEERAIKTAGTNEFKRKNEVQGFPCFRWQDQGAPIFCSEDKNWSDQADPSKMELSYMIDTFYEPQELNHTSSLTQDFVTNCYNDHANQFRAFNLQNMSFILKNPNLLQRYEGS